jgi:hypothetical protein
LTGRIAINLGFNLFTILPLNFIILLQITDIDIFFADIFNIETLKITSALMPRDIVYFIMDWPVMPPILMQQVDKTEPTEPDASGSDLT